MKASERLSKDGRVWDLSLVSISFSTAVGSIATIVVPDLYGENTELLLAIMAVTVLVSSLVVSQRRYEVRARDLFHNYRRAQALSVRAERLKGEPVVSRADYLGLEREYESILDASENGRPSGST